MSKMSNDYVKGSYYREEPPAASHPDGVLCTSITQPASHTYKIGNHSGQAQTRSRDTAEQENRWTLSGMLHQNGSGLHRQECSQQRLDAAAHQDHNVLLHGGGRFVIVFHAQLLLLGVYGLPISACRMSISLTAMHVPLRNNQRMKGLKTHLMLYDPPHREGDLATRHGLRLRVRHKTLRMLIKLHQDGPLSGGS